MDNALEAMLKSYLEDPQGNRRHAITEVMQEIVLCGLSRAGFFDHAAFYGGTALRIFHGLDRFSEGLDFSLVTVNPDFDLSSYFPSLEKEVRAFGLNVTISEKVKTKASTIRSAFLKGNTREHLLRFQADEHIVGRVAKDEIIKIKLEVDVQPPAEATFERKFRLLPTPYEVRLYDLPSLFAGKLHAVLCRAWKNRVKGRDLYDYVFYLSRQIPINARHLRERLIQSGALTPEAEWSLPALQKMLSERFDAIDFERAKDDVLPFLRDNSALGLWSPDFFRQVSQSLTFQ